MSFDEIATEQGWDDASIIIILKNCINSLDPTGKALPRYAAIVAADENAAQSSDAYDEETIREAASVMLAALEQAAAIVPIYLRGNLITQIQEAIAQAKAAGIR